MEKAICPTDLTERQKCIVREVLPELFARKYRYDTFDILNAIVYLVKTLATVNGPSLECVKSNYGNPDFVPLQGRWVVERTFSWIDSYRRSGRNYERYLHTASIVSTLAVCCFLLRYFA